MSLQDTVAKFTEHKTRAYAKKHGYVVRQEEDDTVAVSWDADNGSRQTRYFADFIEVLEFMQSREKKSNKKEQEK